LVFADNPRPETLAQGDILEEVEFFAPRNGGYRDVVRLPGIITSHSCDFTKFLAEREKGSQIDRFPLLVAPLIRTSQFDDKGTAGHARGGRVARYFHLGSELPLSDEDQYVDFWFMQPVAVLELLDITRVASMTDAWQQYLQRSLDRFFAWEDRKAPVEAP
jgi:hypothetical protein